MLGDVGDFRAAEEKHLHDLVLAGIEPGQVLQAQVQFQQLLRRPAAPQFRQADVDFIQPDRPVAAPLARAFGADVIQM